MVPEEADTTDRDAVVLPARGAVLLPEAGKGAEVAPVGRTVEGEGEEEVIGTEEADLVEERMEAARLVVDEAVVVAAETVAAKARGAARIERRIIFFSFSFSFSFVG